MMKKINCPFPKVAMSGITETTKLCRGIAGLSLAAVLMLGACQTPQAGFKEESGKVTFFETLDQKSAKASKSSAVTTRMKQVAGTLEKKLAANSKDSHVRNDLARVYLSLGEFTKADDLVRKSLAADFRDAEATMISAHMAYARFQDNLAILILDKLGKVGQEHPDALNLRALVAIRKQDDTQAIALLTKAASSTQKGVDLTAPLLNLGLLHLKYLQVNDAQPRFEAALQKSPGNLDAKFHLAVCLAAQGKYVEARKIHADMARWNSQYPNINFNYAVLQYRQGDFVNAQSSLSQYLDQVKSGRSDPLAQTLMREIQQQLEVASVSDSKASSAEKISALKSSDKDDFGLDDGYIFTNAGPMAGH